MIRVIDGRAMQFLRVKTEVKSPDVRRAFVVTQEAKDAVRRITDERHQSEVNKRFNKRLTKSQDGTSVRPPVESTP